MNYNGRLWCRDLVPIVVLMLHMCQCRIAGSTQCRSPMFTCRNLKCILPVWILDGNDDCGDGTDEAKLLGSPCGKLNDCCPCSKYIPNSECKAGKCQCEFGFYNSSLGTECIQRTVDSPCTTDSECNDVIKHSSCSNRRCTCDGGYHSDGAGELAGETVCARILLGDACTNFTDCAYLSHAECHRNVCTCLPQHSPRDNATCRPNIIRDPCTTIDDCFPRDSICANFRCACASGFAELESLDACAQRRLGDRCSEDADCNSVILGAECREGACLCPRDHLTVIQNGRDQQCLTLEHPRDIAIIAATVFIISLLLLYDAVAIIWIIKYAKN